ncbi:MAG: glycosyl hydrolase, partial [Flavobacteriaceae bacterium]|nr:glycosyl hydrolase [Flavobacteriaceae bacterium]
MLNYPSFFGVKAGQAVCYSGYRRGQRPGEAIPSRAEVLEDLVLVAQHFDYIRLYSIDDHTEMVLDILSENQIDLKVMIGAYLEAEVNNPHCGWDSGVYSEEVLLANRDKNQH